MMMLESLDVKIPAVEPALWTVKDGSDKPCHGRWLAVVSSSLLLSLLLPTTSTGYT